MDARALLEWAQRTFQGDVILTSSFGAESALMLHLVTRVIPDVRVVFIDTGYLFPETYRFMQELRERFHLNLHVYVPALTSACLHAVHGPLWEGDRAALELYQRLTKVEPMERALKELKPRAWIAGLRREQPGVRSGLRKVELQGSVYRISPILDWSNEEIRRYMKQHNLPYHPLSQLGYRSIGDVHPTFSTNSHHEPRHIRRWGEHRERALSVATRNAQIA